MVKPKYGPKEIAALEKQAGRRLGLSGAVRTAHLRMCKDQLRVMGFAGISGCVLNITLHLFVLRTIRLHPNIARCGRYLL